MLTGSHSMRQEPGFRSLATLRPIRYRSMAVQRTPWQSGAPGEEVIAGRREILERDTEKLLLLQREGSFTFRAVDCLYNPRVFFKTAAVPCLVNARNAEELGLGHRRRHALLCLLTPLVVGSTLSVGRTKEEYRKRNAIPGLTSDDNCLGCCFPWCLICQVRNELDTQAEEAAAIKRITTELLSGGQEMDRE